MRNHDRLNTVEVPPRRRTLLSPSSLLTRVLAAALLGATLVPAAVSAAPAAQVSLNSSLKVHPLLQYGAQADPARIVREGGLPIAAGENLHTLHEFRALIAAGGVTFPEPDVTNCGGVTAFMKICHLAEAFNLPVTSHGAHDLTVHLLAAAPNRSTAI